MGAQPTFRLNMNVENPQYTLSRPCDTCGQLHFVQGSDYCVCEDYDLLEDDAVYFSLIGINVSKNSLAYVYKTTRSHASGLQFWFF